VGQGGDDSLGPFEGIASGLARVPGGVVDHGPIGALACSVGSFGSDQGRQGRMAVVEAPRQGQ
jgi:hypothetical protein